MPSAAPGAEHVDVLVVGAGLSGLSAAYYLQREHPGKRVVLLESRARLGGTWDLFQYPGVRSDSDMYTLGFSFHPWTDTRAIADGGSIRNYLDNAAKKFGIDKRIRFRHRVVEANFNSEQAQWELDVDVGGAGDPDEQLRGDVVPTPIKRVRFTTRFMMLCSGYYRYSSGYAPEFPGAASFAGRLVHPQLWPSDLDVRGKRVVVVGSGATAVTLVPALAERGAEEVTMLQRSPTYMMTLPSVDPVARLLNRLLPTMLLYQLLRWKQIFFFVLTFWLCRSFPSLVKTTVRKRLACLLPSTFDMVHLTPNYDPWKQRFCLVPDGDLFKTLSEHKARIVTAHIDTFTKDGIRLKSGEELAADVIVTATGLHMQLGGGMKLCVDGRAVDVSACMLYQGMLLSGVPNACVVFGYTNASWTLKAELVCERICKLLKHMDEHGADTSVALPGPDVRPEPLLDFTSGYVLRAAGAIPKQGSQGPWRVHQHYIKDLFNMRTHPVNDGVLQFSSAGQTKSKRN